MKRLTALPMLLMTLGKWYRSNRAGAARYDRNTAPPQARIIVE